MTDIILQIVMMTGAAAVGYGIREMRHPLQKRDARGRFIKK